MCIRDRVDFALEYSNYYNDVEREELEYYVDLHRQYGTLLSIYDKDQLICVARWNWLSWHTIQVIDVIVKPGYRHLGILKYLLSTVKTKYPLFKWFTYDRHKDGKSRGYAVKQWLKGDSNGR